MRNVTPRRMPPEALVCGGNLCERMFCFVFVPHNDGNFLLSKELKSRQNESEQARCLSTCFPFIVQLVETNISFHGRALFFHKNDVSNYL